MSKPPMPYSNKEGPRTSSARSRGPYQTRNQRGTETFIAICLDGATSEDSSYCLASSRVFTTLSQAEEYIKQIHPMRKPLIVKGDWISFRLPD